MFNLSGRVAALYSSTAVKYSLPERRGVTRWTLMLPGAGCEYWKKTHGGCTMCGFNGSTNKYTRGALYPSSFFKVLYRLSKRATAAQHPEEISVFNGGSFWNDNEIPADFQRYLFRDIARERLPARVMIESRCEYITQPKIVEALEMLDGKKLKIAIGLESQDDHVRNRLIRKGLSKRDFESKVRMARNYGAEIQAYVFLKPLGLDEKRAMHDALDSIGYALSVGATEVEISCAFIQSGTAMAEAFFRGEFRPPYLWTILKIIEEILAHDWPVSIGGFSDEPPPIAIPANCPDCSPDIYNLIERFRQTRKLGEIPNCPCKKGWEELTK